MKVDRQNIRTERFTIDLLPDGQNRRWDTFVESHPNGSTYHRTVWRDLIKDLFGHESYYLRARAGSDDIIGVLPLVRLKSHLFGDFMVSMPYFNYGGAIAINAEVEEALMEQACVLANDTGCKHIEFRDTSPRNEHWGLRTDKTGMELALPSSADQLWSGFGSNLRRKIRRPQKEGVEVLHGAKDLLPDFYQVFCRNMRDLGTPVYCKAFFTSILETFADTSSIIVLRLNREPVASMFLLAFNDRLEMPWVASVQKFNRLMVNMLLYWEALRFAIQSGYKVFDFGRSTRDSGTYRFKAQWGATERQLYWHYWLPEGRAMPGLTPSNPRYRLAVKIWRHLPLFLANRLGPIIVKNLP